MGVYVLTIRHAPRIVAAEDGAVLIHPVKFAFKPTGRMGADERLYQTFCGRDDRLWGADRRDGEVLIARVYGDKKGFEDGTLVYVLPRLPRASGIDDDAMAALPVAGRIDGGRFVRGLDV